MILLKLLFVKHWPVPAGRHSAVSAAHLYLHSATNFTYSIILDCSQKVSGHITSAELCQLIQKDTLGSSKLRFIMISWHRHCSFLKIYVLGFLARKRMGIWVLLDGSRMVLNPVPVSGCLATVRLHLIFHWCTFGFKTIQFQKDWESNMPPI